jgi:hypothetical protein
LIDVLDEGVPGPEHFSIKEEPVPTEVPDGAVLVQVLTF